MRYALTRLVYLAAITIAVTFLVSASLDLLPGDTATAMAGDHATPEQVDALRKSLDLDKSMVHRYLSWLGGAIHGDLGRSLRTNEPVSDAVRGRLPVTAELVIGAQLLALLFALPTAIYTAYRPGRIADAVSSVASFAMISVPHFVLGVALILLFAVKLRWLPIAGFVPLRTGVDANLRSMLLPMVALAAEPAGVYQRLLRNDLAMTLDEDFILTAEAKGLSQKSVLLRHALRPSSFSLVTLTGILTARMIGGSVVIETIFALPGISQLLVQAIQAHDYITVQGVVAFISVAYVAINTMVDLLYGALDPRVRRGAR